MKKSDEQERNIASRLYNLDKKVYEKITAIRICKNVKLSRRCLKNHFSHQFKNVLAFLLRDARHLTSDIKLEPRIVKNKI